MIVLPNNIISKLVFSSSENRSWYGLTYGKWSFFWKRSFKLMYRTLENQSCWVFRNVKFA
jgi:hypothetical protein